MATPRDSRHPWVVTHARKIAIPTTTASGIIFSQGGTLLAVCISETTGSSGASVDFVDGESSDSDEIVPYTLLANESVRDSFSPLGIPFDRGVYLVVNSGSVKGSITVGHFRAWPTGIDG